MDAATVEIYEQRAAEYLERRGSRGEEQARRFAGRIRSGGVRLDAGCGPGIDAPGLGGPLLLLDASRAMLLLAGERSGARLAVQADLAALPIRDGALAGTWARCSYVHLPAAGLPGALGDLHRACEEGALVRLVMLSVTREGRVVDDDFPGRFFAGCDEAFLADVMVGAGFGVDALVTEGRNLVVEARCERTLADTVSGAMRVLVCGLNPSLHAADAGVGYAGPGNRFWPAAVAAGLVERPFDARAALRVGVGMTDLVKRATPRAGDLSAPEYAQGAGRVERLVRWLRPGAVCFVGLSGYRAAVDRRAVPGWQGEGFGGAPAYVMPSTSGLNARTALEDLVGHLRAVQEPPG